MDEAKRPAALAAWHRIAASLDPAGLDELLDDDAVFHSPIVHTPQRGKALAAMYLSAAMHVFGAGEFRYVREIVSESDAALEFIAVIDGIEINGIDLMHWNDQGRIDDFKVLVRPLKAIQLLHRLMGEMLAQLGPRT